ncbi:MAG: cation transporter [Nitrospirae bacterium]|nr:MAG: cation transporter [Nitrospirota bacterium]
MNKSRAALISVLSNLSLIILKVIASIMTGSISVLSEALHSAMDLLAALIALFSVKKAESPADKEHPFGHGKYENLSGLIEGSLILFAALMIVYEAVKKAITGPEIKQTEIAIAVMAFSAVVNLLVSSYLMRVARRTDSLALEADALHLRVDVYSSAGVLAGLVIIRQTGLDILDSIIAAIVAMLVLNEGIGITRKSIGGLLDRSLPEEELEIIKKTLEEYSHKIKDYHSLRSRKSGSERHLDLHITVCQNEKIATTHETMDQIERKLQSLLPNLKIIIHPEPCSHHSENCPAECYYKRSSETSAGKAQ